MTIDKSLIPSTAIAEGAEEIPDLDAIVGQYRHVIREIEDLETLRDALKDQMKALMGDLMELRGPDYKILYTPVSQSRVDTKLLSATYPEAFRACQKTVSYRRFEVK